MSTSTVTSTLVRWLQTSAKLILYALLLDFFGIFIMLGMPETVQLIGGIALSALTMLAVATFGWLIARRECKTLDDKTVHFWLTVWRGFGHILPLGILCILTLLVGNALEIPALSAVGYLLVLPHTLIYMGAGWLELGSSSMLFVLIYLPLLVSHLASFVLGYVASHFYAQHQKQTIVTELHDFGRKF